MKNYIQKIKYFLNDEKGNVLIMVGIFILVTVAIAGAALDIGRAQLLQMKLQQSTDIAALASANVLHKDTTDPNEEQIRHEAADRYYSLNFPETYLGISRVLPDFAFDKASGQITVTNSSTIGTNYIASLGLSSIDVSSLSKITIPDKTYPDFDVAIVMDESLSVREVMPDTGLTISQTEKNAISTMLDSLFPANQAYNPNLRFGLIGYAAAITHAFGLTADVTEAKNNVAQLTTYVQNYDHMALEAGFNLLTGIWNGYTPPTDCIAYTLIECTAEENTSVPPPSTTRDDSKLVSDAKYLIFITDGRIMVQPAPCTVNFFGYGAEFDLQPGDTCRNYKAFLRKCDALKAAGVTVYVINFYTQSVDDIDTLTACASSPSKYYFAPDGDTLTNILTGIATQVHSIRITD